MRHIKRTLYILLSILLTIFFARAFESREQMPLGAEHQIILKKDFSATRDQSLDWAGYQALEQEVFQEFEAKIEARSHETSLLSRHSAKGANNPNRLANNWNLSYKVEPARELKGSAVLIHGLTDSPYSMKATAHIFSEAGLETFVPRMPGHGFNAGSLHFQGQRGLAGCRSALVSAPPTAARETGPAPRSSVATPTALSWLCDTLSNAIPGACPALTDYC